MAHLPVNHHLRPLYRTLAGVAGLYVLVFGVVGVIETRDIRPFAQEGLPPVLGLRANGAFAILSIVAGLVIVAGAVLGRNLDRWINLVGGVVFLVAGMAMMSLMETDLNVLGFTMSTCVVSFLIGLVLLTAGLYGRAGSPREQALEEDFRHGARPDPQEHAWQFEDGPKPTHQTEDHRFA
jgi:hypothetical protein